MFFEKMAAPIKQLVEGKAIKLAQKYYEMADSCEMVKTITLAVDTDVWLHYRGITLANGTSIANDNLP